MKLEIKRIPLVLLPLSSANTIGARFRGIGVRVASFYPSVRYDLRNISVNVEAEGYCSIAFLSAAIWSLLITLFVGFVATRSSLPPNAQVLMVFLSFTLVFLFFLILHLAYPKIIAKNIAARVDRELIFAMRDLLIQISSGIPVFTAIDNVAASNYEYVSREFQFVSMQVKGGTSLVSALEEMAVRTQSEYLKKTSWQMVTAIRAGAQMDAALKGIVKMLVDYQFSVSKSFTAELNFIILVYLMISAVLPTIGTTVLVIFSVFGMLGISPEVFGGIIGASFLGQMGIIAYVKLKRPSLFV
jgi:pilus assembly protein TadC